MPDFAPNVTPRYRLHYHAVGREHTIMCRVARGVSFSAVESNGTTYLRGVFNALASLLVADLAFTSAEIALTDSDLFFPAAVPTAVVGAVLLADYSKQDSITHLTFSGRGAGGSKVNMKVYGVVTNPDQLPVNAGSDFVFLGTEIPQVASVVTHLNTVPALSVAIDNTIPRYANRATIKVNDFWLRQVRKGL